MKNVAKIFGLMLLIFGSVLSVFTDVPVADYTGIALDAVGLAVLIFTTWGKSEEKSWKVAVSIAAFTVGGFLCGIVGFAENTISQIILAITGIVVLILGLITTIPFKPKEKKE